MTSYYAYLGNGARISSTMGSETTTYTLDLAAPLVQVLVASQGSTATAYLYGVARIGEDDGTWYYHLADHPSGKPQDYSLGSVRTLAGADGSVGATRAYRPYGTPLHSAGDAASRYGFTGEQTDATGLVYLRARMYAPSLSVFLNRDAWEGSAPQPRTLQGFNYGGTNPVNRIDPTGLAEIMAWSVFRDLLLTGPSSGGVDIATDGQDGIADPNPTTADMAMVIVSMNFEQNPLGDLITPLNDIQCYEARSHEPGVDYNQYDWMISGWTSYWNWRKRISGKQTAVQLPDISANLMKAIAFEESNIGVNSGNVMQVTDGFDTYRNQANLRTVQGANWQPYDWGYINVGAEFENDPFDTIAYGIRYFLYKIQIRSVAGLTMTDSERDWRAVLRGYGPGDTVDSSYGWRVWQLYAHGYDPHFWESCDSNSRSCEGSANSTDPLF